MIKLKYLILAVIITAMLSGQSEAKEIKPLFGMYKIVSHEVDDYLNQNWTEIYMDDEAAKVYPKLSKSLREYFKEKHDLVIENQQKYHKEAVEMSEESGQIRQFFDHNEIIVCRADSVVLSLLEMPEDYMGGVHGMYGYFGVNFDTATGKRLTISDVCTNTEVLVKAIMTRLHEDSPNSPFENAEKYIMEQVIKDDINFIIEPNGVSFHFNPYEIGSYAEGIYTATLLFNEYPKLFKAKYQQLPSTYCQTLPLYHSNIVSFGKGIRNFIKIGLADDNNYEIISGSGNAKDKIGLKGIQPPTLIHMTNGKNYLFVDGFIDNKGRFLHVYDVSDNGLELVNVLPYTFKNIGTSKYETWWIPTDPNNIQFDSNEPIGAKGVKSHIGGVNNDGSIAFG